MRLSEVRGGMRGVSQAPTALAPQPSMASAAATVPSFAPTFVPDIVPSEALLRMGRVSRVGGVALSECLSCARRSASGAVSGIHGLGELVQVVT